MSLRGIFGNSSSSSSRKGTTKNNVQHSGSDPHSPTRRSFAFMKYSPGRRSNSSMRRIREHAGQIAQQVSTPDPHDSSFNPYGASPRHSRMMPPEPQDRNASSLYDNVIDVNRRPLKPPAKNRKKVALSMFMEQKGPKSSGPGSVGSDASSRASSVTGAAARRLARAKQHQQGNSMSTLPSNSSMQRNFVQKQSSNQSSSSSTAARRRMRSQLKKESVSTVDTFYSEIVDEATPRRPSSGGSSGRQGVDYSRQRLPSTDDFSAASPDLNSVDATHGFSFDAFGLDAEEVDSEVNAALQDLAGSHPDLSRMFGGEKPPFILDSPAGSFSASTPTMDISGDSPDGFRMISSLPMNVSRPSPASSERSTLTGSSPTDGNDHDGRINMFKQQAGFQRSRRKPVSDDGWESFEPSPSTTRYAVSEPGGVFFGSAWSDDSVRRAPPMPNLVDEADSTKEPEPSDKGSDADFDQSSWQGDSDGELSPENAKQFQSNDKPKGESFTFDADFGESNVDTSAQSSAGESGIGYGFGTPLHLGSDVGAPSSVGGARLESDAGASSRGAPSDVGVAMHFDSDVGVASDAGVNSDFKASAIPDQILGKVSKSKRSQDSVAAVQADDDDAFDSDGFGVPVKKVSSLAAKWERQENEQKEKVIRSPSRQISKSLVSSQTNQMDEELVFPEVVRTNRVDSPLKSPQKSAACAPKSPADAKVKRIRLKELPSEGPIGPDILSDEPVVTALESYKPVGPEILTKTKVKKQTVQQKRAAECAEQRTSFGSYKERLRPAHLRNGIRPTSSKSEAGGYGFSGQSQMNSFFNKMQSPREAKSESGASSDFLSGVKLRNTGGITRLLSMESSEDGTEKTDPEFGSSHHESNMQVPQHDLLAHEEHREPGKCKTVEQQQLKLSYRERRELELKQQRAEQAKNEKEQREKEQKERDVAALIRKRVAANRKKTVEADIKSKKPEEDITAIRNRLKKVAVDSDSQSLGKPSPIALEELTLTTENSYSSNSLEKASAEHASHPQHDFAPASSLAGGMRENEKRMLSVEPSYDQVPTHVHALRSNDIEEFATFSDTMDNHGVPANDSDETPKQKSPSPTRKVALEVETAEANTTPQRRSPSPARKMNVETEQVVPVFGDAPPQRSPSPVRKVSAQNETELSRTPEGISQSPSRKTVAKSTSPSPSRKTVAKRTSHSPSRKTVAESEPDISRTPPASAPSPPTNVVEQSMANDPEPNASKESKKAMLSAFFGKRLGPTGPPSERDTAEEEKKRPESPPFAVDPFSAEQNPFRDTDVDKSDNDALGEASPQPSSRGATQEVSAQEDMDVHAATAVLVRKNQQSQAPQINSENDVQGQGGETTSLVVQSDPTTSTMNGGQVALKDDPAYEKYFRMLKVGMPMEVVKHAMTRDGIDASVMDGDHNKPAGGVPLKEDPKFEKYFKMMKMGLPMGAVQNAMVRDGLDPTIMEGDHNAPAGASVSASTGKVENKQKDTHRRTRLHWETLRKVRANSLWAKINEDPELQQLHIDEEEFASLFQAELTPSRFQSKKSPTPSSPAKKRRPSVRVIDAKRANNGGIALARLHITQDDLADVVDKIDDSVITAEQMQHIVQYLPTAEERKGLEQYMLEGGQDAAEKFDMLCECEKFMVAMMTVKHAKRKVRALLFKLQFRTCLDSLEADAATVEAACDELSNSVRLRKLLGIVLNIGNRLNTAGNGGKRKAGAFTLESLLKLSHAKAFDRKTTFLHYVVLIVQRNNELLLRFKDDLPTVMKANKVYWDQCLTDLEQVENQLENVRKMAIHQARLQNIYRLKKKKKPPSDNGDEDSLSDISITLEEEVETLRATPLGLFTLHAIKKVSSLRQQVEETNQKFGKLLEYFGEEDKRSEMQPHELFTIMFDFCKDFDKAKEQVVANEKKKLREERKRQASSKKLLSTPKVTPRQASLKLSNMQPNMSNVFKDLAPKSPSVKSDPGQRPAYPNNTLKAPVQRPPEQRNDAMPMARAPSQAKNHERNIVPDAPARSSPPRKSSLQAKNHERNIVPDAPARSSPPRKSAPSIPADPYGSNPTLVVAPNNTLRQKARLRRQKQVANAKSPVESSIASATEQSGRSNSPTSHHQGRPPLDQTLSPRSSIRQKRRMQQRNGLVGSQRR